MEQKVAVILDDADALRRRGETAFSEGNWAAAAAAYEQLVPAGSSDLKTLVRLAWAYRELGRVADAVALLKEPSTAGFLKAKRTLAAIHIEAKDYEAALPLVDELLASTPDDPKLLKQKEVCTSKLASGTGAPDLMHRAQALFSANRFEEAEQAYQNVLANEPNTVLAHLRLGQICVAQRRWDDAVPRLRTALRLDPANAKTPRVLAYALLKGGEPAQAIAVLDTVLGRGDDVDVRLMLQRCHAKLSDWPRVVELGSQLLNVLSEDDPRRSSVEELRQAALFETELERVDAILESGDFEEAVAGYRQLTERNPDLAAAWLSLGGALAKAGQEAEAITAFKEALRCRPDEEKARTALTSLIIKTWEESEILRYVQDAICQKVADYDCYRWLAEYHYRRHNWHAALRSAQHALAMRPDDSSARMWVARSLMRLCLFAEAIEELDLLLKTRDRRVIALQLKADTLIRLARVEDAIQLYQQALEAEPDNALIKHRLSYAFLLKGDIETFHKLYDERRNVKSFIENNKAYPFPDWNGELSIDGKLLVWGEFGLGVGMNIMHMTSLKPLAALGTNVVLEVEPRLVDLCRRSFPDIEVVADALERPLGISHHTPIGSLSRWFKPDLASFDNMTPFLMPDPQQVAGHRDRLQRMAGDGQLLVGISWSSTNPFVGDVKCVPINQLLSAIDVPGVTLVNLQYGDHSESIALAERQTGKRLIDSGIDNGNDLDGLSAVVAAMDMVVCIGHTTAHIAGGVGTPNLVMLPATPFGHWLDKGEGCIWYPNSRLFRRAPIDDDWGILLQQVQDAVVEFRNEGGQDSWLSTTLLPGLCPKSATAEPLSDRALRDAVLGFYNQGACRSALHLMDRLSSNCLSRELEVLRGDMLALIGEWEQARSHYMSLRSGEEPDRLLDEKIVSASLALHDLESALPIARSLANEDPTYRFVAANILYHLRDHQGALNELRDLSFQAPQAEHLSTLTGSVLLEMGEYERAEKYLSEQAAMTRLPEDYTLLGRAISAQGRPEEALVAYEKAVMRSRKNPSANFWRTQTRIDLGLVERSPLPPLLGDLPEVSPDDAVIFFAVDSAYFWRHGLVLIASAARNSPHAKCHVHVINPDEGVERAVQVIRERLPDLALSYSYEQADFADCSEMHLRTYYASVRFVRLAEVFARAPAHYLCVDADGLIRGNVSSTVVRPQEGDLDLYLRYHKYPQMAVLASAALLRPTPAARHFVNRVSELIGSTLEAREAIWFLDQIVLGHVVRELGGEAVNISQIDQTYIDWFFADESLIWTAKGKRKSDDSRFIAEVGRYRYLQQDERIVELMPEDFRCSLSLSESGQATATG